ncbi:hypothetical protein G5B30_16655 [Sphingobacterium sp. SGG-5]|uniref:hypothetical protein n=1 Tax=Sphingobacterium sp. SGG-5 TaxID=2710881 RepID=UPI0013EAFB8A|nr:hypothetical protein [Sphingobacterium sp. SGG-5]NGM63542.1 hypothetical protein [Sphingobacterium sp. SGG-5]
MKATSIEELIKYLNDLGISTEYNDGEPGKFNRLIKFTVNEIEYFIEWWVNQSYLKFGNCKGCANLPFKYISVNPNNPTKSFKFELCFYDELVKNEGQFSYCEYPFGCLKIPFNKARKEALK